MQIIEEEWLQGNVPYSPMCIVTLRFFNI